MVASLSLVGMVLARQLAPGAAHRIVAGRVGDAEHGIGVGGVGAEIFLADAREGGIVEAEDARHIGDVFGFLVDDAAIGLGDVEQAVEQFLEDGGVGGEHAGDLARIRLVSGGGFARLVEHPGDVPDLGRRHLEDLAEGGDLVPGHHAVGLGELGAEGDDGDGEADLLGRVGSGLGARFGGQFGGLARIVDVTGDAADQRAERPAKRKAGGAAENFSPDAHDGRCLAQSRRAGNGFGRRAGIFHRICRGRRGGATAAAASPHGRSGASSHWPA